MSSLVRGDFGCRMGESLQPVIPGIALTEDVEFEEREYRFGFLQLKFKNKEFEKLYRLFFEKVNRSLLVVVCILMVFLGTLYFLSFLAQRKVSNFACDNYGCTCKLL